jgi:hypothetical protein
MMNFKEMELSNSIVDARGAGEFSSTSGLACILVGLSQAPQIYQHQNSRIKDAVNIHNVLAVVAPASALGGVPMLYGISVESLYRPLKTLCPSKEIK